jgi:hypothetical protein
VRSQAKASSSGSTQRRAAGLDGNAPMGPRHRSWLSVLVTAIGILATLLVAAPALAAKQGIDTFGTTSDSGNLGGEFNQPRDVAVNSTGVGAPQGTIYVVDDGNHRIQRFDPDGDFVSAWGANVTHRNEVQLVTFEAGSGTFTLSFKGSTTAPIEFGVEAGTVDNALDALPSIGGDANVAVSGVQGGPYTVTFTGALTGIDVNQLTVDGTNLLGSATAKTLEAGFGGGGTDYEICTVAMSCADAVATGGNGTMAGNGGLDNPQSVAVDGNTGNVYVSDRDNRRVNAYDASGNFLFSVGRDVQNPDGGTAVEICNGATDSCRQGDGGSGPGEIGSNSSGGIMGIAVSPPDGNAATGTVFLADTQNRRVNTYALDGTSPSSFGSATQFGVAQPTKVAVDSVGIAYASNSNEGGQVERYDSAGVHGPAGFLAPIQTPFNETQTITFTGFIAGDTFTLTCPNGEATATVTYATGSTGRINIQNALEAKCGTGNIATAGNPPNTTVTFQGAFASTNVPTTVCAKLTGAGSCAISLEVNGHTGPLLGGTPASATVGLVVDPDSDGGGSDEDVLHVLRDPSIGNTVVQQFGPVNDPGALSAPTAVDDTHGAATGFSTVQGFGLDDQAGRLFVSATTNIGGIGGGHRVYVLDDSVPSPTATIDPVTVKGETTATFSASVDPMGGYTTCKFQYSTDQFAWTNVAEPDCGSLAIGGGPQPVSQEVTGLLPNTHYFARLQISHALAAEPPIATGVKAFDTDTFSPFVSGVGAVDIQDTSARMVGTIDPRNSATGYVFEYGTTPALGSATAPIDIGGGLTSKTVSQVVGGLDPDTTYYFRLVATNLAGSTHSDAATLHTRALPLPLPEDRAYEQVSPTDKNFGDAATSSDPVSHRSYAIAARDGDAFAFSRWGASQGEPPAQVSTVDSGYLTRRSPDGWLTISLNPRFCGTDPAGPDGGLINANAADEGLLSPNLDRAVLTQPEYATCPIPLLDPTAPAPQANLYLADFTANPFSYQLLAPEPSANASPTNQTRAGQYRAGSDDRSHVVYTSTGQQTPDAPIGNFEKVFEWHDGTLSLVSRDTANAPFLMASSVPRDATNGVSTNGDRIFFQNPDSGANEDLYMRENGAVTHHVSASECTSACGSSAADVFMQATPDGERVLFTSQAKLTNDDSSSSGADLYLYTHSVNPSVNQNLTLLSKDNEPGDGTNASVLGVIGASDNGDTVFFVAGGQIISGESTALGTKVYRWRWNAGNPTAEYLASLRSFATTSGFHSDIENWALDPVNALGSPQRRVTPDGKYLMVETTMAIDPLADQDTHIDVYRWEEQEGWACVSCQPPGDPSLGPSSTGMTSVNDKFTREQSIALTDDGRIFFVSRDGLVPADVNGESPCPKSPTISSPQGTDQVYPCTDVYEWNEGAVNLISTGLDNTPESENHALLLGATPSGNDVFFATRERLVGWDDDNNIDIYDARVGGGFSEPPATGAPCEGEACRGTGTSAPSISGAGTGAFEGPGNPVSRTTKRCPKGKRKVRRSGTVRCVPKHQRKRTAKHDRRATR